jgi:hypothetical protein
MTAAGRSMAAVSCSPNVVAPTGLVRAAMARPVAAERSWRAVAESARRLEITARGPLVLLFYDGYELKARPGLLGAAYSQGRRAARYAYRTARRRQVRTGFYTAFLSLCRSLRLIGCDVRVNDFGALRKRPHYPIGLCGYPSVLAHVAGENPVIFGHGDLGLPEAAAVIAAREQMRLLIQPCDWACAFNRPYCGDKLRAFPVGVDSAQWHLPKAARTHDFLVYDKIRWYRDERVPAIRDRLIESLRARGHSVAVLQYGAHRQDQYRRALASCGALLFLCEHETQGIAYQEALAAGVPVLAWDEGELVDPNLRHYAPHLRVSSVPYFDDRCGMRFTLASFDEVVGQFWAEIERFRPRDYVDDRLSMRRAGRDYLSLYSSIAG